MSLDKYYTKDETVAFVVDIFEKYVNVSSDDVIIEPSAGDGAFLKRLDHPNVIGFDIAPEGPGIAQCDFLEYEAPTIYEKIHVLGNPPFGRNGSMALKFLKKSMQFAETVSFIIPRSFKKESMQMRIPKNFELVVQVDVPKMSFLIEGNPYDVPCVFQIWSKTDVLRTYNVLKPAGYSFVRKSEDHHCAIRRVGGTAGMVVANTDTSGCNENCFYFIRFDSEFDIGYLCTMTIVERNDSTGPRSISKRELIRHMNPLMI
jgi:hypothetical protein